MTSGQKLHNYTHFNQVLLYHVCFKSLFSNDLGNGYFGFHDDGMNSISSLKTNFSSNVQLTVTKTYEYRQASSNLPRAGEIYILGHVS